MTLLMSLDQLEARRAVAGGPLRPLAESLATDLAAVIARPLYVPDEKALLSREGGRCPRDGTMLDFDPFSPRAHTCPRCGAVYVGELHDRSWVYWYQLWIAERAVHGALLGILGAAPGGLDFAVSVLEVYCDKYSTYPNVDNALGPTRPFFSTYLESIWLLQLCIALDLLEMAGSGSTFSGVGSRFRDLVIEPSLLLIRSYDEGMSNRQVWNNAAMMAANRVLGRDDEAESIAWSESGLAMHLTEALLPDGTWYEGENYHLFAHRGLSYSVAMAEHAGIELPATLIRRFNAGFSTPFLTALPDFTLPSRRDSQYAISLRQWRFAEMCELGVARHDDRILVGALSRLYADDVPRLDTGRSRSSAEAERNMPATALSRADLGWRSLMFARTQLASAGSSPLSSVLLESQGIGVLRRDAGEVYVALDYGHSGGGHGHPDRLNLLLACGGTRWLDDYGTGSYVDPSLHWYRSTLAHNAPLIDGRSQRRADGVLDAFEDRGGAGWVSATAPIASNGSATRTVVTMPEYLVDELTWDAPGARSLDLPIHVDATIVNIPTPPTPTRLSGSNGLEDGFDFLRNTSRVAIVSAGEAIQLRGFRGDAALDLWIAGDAPFELWKCTAPAAPGYGDAPFLIVRSAAPTGTLRTVLSWSGAVKAASLFPAIAIENHDERHEHTRVTHGWNVALLVGGAQSSIDLEGLVPRPDPAFPEPGESADEPRHAIVLKPGQPVRVRLGAESYRRSEETWAHAGEPTAEVTFENENGELVIEVAVTNVDRTFVASGAPNRLDNESPDVNGAGIQLYLRTDDAQAGYVLVPQASGEAVAVRPINGWGSGLPVEATWTDVDTGYVIEIHIGGLSAGTVIDLDVIVNEKPANRERRRGQLVLSGGAGEFVYLRGDRQAPDRLIPMLLTDV